FYYFYILSTFVCVAGISHISCSSQSLFFFFLSLVGINYNFIDVTPCLASCFLFSVLFHSCSAVEATGVHSGIASNFALSNYPCTNLFLSFSSSFDVEPNRSIATHFILFCVTLIKV